MEAGNGDWVDRGVRKGRGGEGARQGKMEKKVESVVRRAQRVIS